MYIPMPSFCAEPYAVRTVKVKAVTMGEARKRALEMEPACSPAIVGMRWDPEEVGGLTTFTVRLDSGARAVYPQPE